jgi:hypothetical protein
MGAKSKIPKRAPKAKRKPRTASSQPTRRKAKTGKTAKQAKGIAAAGAPSLRSCDLEYEEADRDDGEVRAAVKRLEAADRELLRAAESYVAQYCEESLATYGADDRPDVHVQAPGDVWRYVELGGEMTVTRRAEGDAEDGVYFSIGCSCEWEPEHGLQLVIRDGRAVTKVGPFDGHVTNADAYDNRAYVGVVYVSHRSH